MAASLLSVIDWDNLDSSELTTACKLLMKATQERFSIGYMKIDGSGTQNGSGAYKDIFPYGSNTPKYRLDSGDPLIIDSVELEAMLKEIGRNYFDRTLWLAELGGTSFSYNSVALYHPSSNNAIDSVTYSSRLLELAGHTSYPDFSETITTSEVKKWYDIITQMKYCQRIITSASQGDEYDLYRIGEFDVELNAPITGDPGARKEAEKDYGTGDYLTLPSGTEYGDFKTAFDSLPNTANSESDYNGTGTYDPSRPYYMRVYKSGAVPGVYHTTLCYYKMRHEIEYDTLQAEIGHTGMPKDLFRENKYTVVSSAFDDTEFTAPTYSETEDETYEADLTEVTTGTLIKLTEELPITSFGTAPSSLSSNSSPTTAKQWKEEMELREQPFRFVEFWDYEGGFDYYTP